MSAQYFSDLHLTAPLLKAITDLGFEKPTPIQAQSITPLLNGRDVVGVAQTGTGKTAAFGLPLLSRIDADNATIQAIVLAPTRELAMQNSKALESFAAHMPSISIATVYGGSSYGPQIGALRRGAQIVVGTPGRIMDLMDKGEIDLHNISFFVLDEADEMLRMGFEEDVEKISADIPDNAVRALFSATMPPAIQKVADNYLHDPIRVEVTPQASTVDNIHQTYAVVPYKFKTDALIRVLSVSDAKAVIVFVATRLDADEVAHEVARAGFQTAAISGDVNQQERERIVERLRNGTLNVLVATDVAARGLDVDRIELVVNYDVPKEAEAYVHRIGRTGRAGRKGTSLTFFTPREAYRLHRIEKLTGSPLECVTVPRPDEVTRKVAEKTLQRAYDRALGDLGPYQKIIAQQVRDGVDLQKLAASLLALSAQDKGLGPVVRGDGRHRREENLDDSGRFISAEFEGSRKRDDRPRRGTSKSEGGRPRKKLAHAKRYRIEVGHRDGVKPGAIVGAITGEAPIRGSQLGHITINKSFSLVEIDGGLSPKVAKRLAKTRVAGRYLKIREDPRKRR